MPDIFFKNYKMPAENPSNQCGLTNKQGEIIKYGVEQGRTNDTFELDLIFIPSELHVYAKYLPA